MLQRLKHEIRLLFNRPLVFLVLIGAASGYALLIGNLYRGETVQNIPVSVCDLEDSALSRELIRSVSEADQYNYIETLTDELVAAEMLKRGELAAVLVIPKNFSKQFYTQHSIELAFLQDDSNILQASYTLPPIQSMVSDFASKHSSQNALSNTSSTSKNVSMSLRMIGNPTQSYLF